MARAPVSRCTSSTLIRAERLGQSLGLALLQTGNRNRDTDQTLSYGFKTLLTPDLRAQRTWDFSNGDTRPRVVRTESAVISNRQAVTAVIDDNAELVLQSWSMNAQAGNLGTSGSRRKSYSLVGSFSPFSTDDTQLHSVPSSPVYRDLLSTELWDEVLRLKLWQISGGE